MTKSAKPAPPVKVGDRIELTISDLIGGGEALARHEGFAVFVPYAVPGDVIRAHVISTKPGYARATIEEVLKPSPERITPACGVFTRCGGCTWQGMDYAGQVAWKTRLVGEALQRFGGIDPQGVLQPTIASPEPWHYRNKVHWAVGKQGNRWQVGLFEPRSHRIVEAESCAIQSPLNNRMLAVTRQLLDEFDFPPYDEATGKGFLRSVFVKAGHQTGEVMLGLVTTRPELRKEDKFIAWVKKHAPEVTTLVHNVHPEPGNKLLGRDTRILFGPGVIKEKVGPLEFLISAGSFFQVNSATIETLYDQVAAEADAGSGPRVVDAYSGTGSIALYMAAKGASQVVGLEIIKSAVKDATENAQRNGLEAKASFVLGAVEDMLPELVGNGLEADVVVLDPPRKGAEGRVLETIAEMGVKKIVYVSCDPVTLSRDLKVLGGLGYVTKRVQPVDMFPQTAHVECVATLVREAT